MNAKVAGFNQYAIFDGQRHIGWVKREHRGIYRVRTNEFQSWFPEKYTNLTLAAQGLFKEVQDAEGQ